MAIASPIQAAIGAAVLDPDAVAAVGFDLDYTLWDQGVFAGSFFDGIAGEFGRRLGWGRKQVAGALHGALRRLTPAHPGLFDDALHQLGAWDPRLVAELVDRYHRHRPPMAPYPGVAATLRRLRDAGLRLFLVTDGRPGTQRYKVEALGLGPWFDQVVFTGDLPEARRKPSPFPFQLACERLGLAPGRCVFVGDHPALDFPGPRALGMATIGVSTGPFAALPGASWERPDLRIGPVAELAGLLPVAAGGPGGPA